MASFANSSDMEKRFDVRTLKDLVSDTGVPATNLSTNSAMTTALSDATGLIKSACQVGGIYTEDDLEDLTGESESLLKRLTCEITLGYLLLRRPEKYNKVFETILERANETLDQFRMGARIFNVSGNLVSSLPSVGGPNTGTWRRLNLIRDRTRNTYPHREDGLPLGR